MAGASGFLGGLGRLLLRRGLLLLLLLLFFFFVVLVALVVVVVVFFVVLVALVVVVFLRARRRFGGGSSLDCKETRRVRNFFRPCSSNSMTVYSASASEITPRPYFSCCTRCDTESFIGHILSLIPALELNKPEGRRKPSEYKHLAKCRPAHTCAVTTVKRRASYK